VKITSLIFLIFRFLLDFLGLGRGNCMYYPTCSFVVNKAIDEKGLIRALPLVFGRMFTCNPIYRKIGKNWQ